MALYRLMTYSITLSDHTKDLIGKIETNLPSELHREVNCLDQEQLLEILTHWDTKGKSNRFLLESLRTSLLKDLSQALLRSKEKEVENPPKKASFFAKLKFGALMVGGTILAICEGYDGIISFFPLVTMPVWLGQIILGVFALLSVLTFYAFELDQISENIGVKLPEIRRLLDVLVEQSKEVNLIRKKIKLMNSDDEDELNRLSAIVEMLIHTQNELNALKEEFNDGFNNPYLNIVKIAATVVTGVIYFSGGFFASQIPSVSFFALLGITLTVSAWPVVVASTLIGLAAFGVYWYVQRPAVDSLVANLFGLDKNKIQSLENCKTNAISNKEMSGVKRLLKAKEEIAEKKKSLTHELTMPILEDLSTAPLFVSLNEDGHAPLMETSFEFPKSPHCVQNNDNPSLLARVSNAKLTFFAEKSCVTPTLPIDPKSALQMES